MPCLTFLLGLQTLFAGPFWPTGAGVCQPRRAAFLRTSRIQRGDAESWAEYLNDLSPAKRVKEISNLDAGIFEVVANHITKPKTSLAEWLTDAIKEAARGCRVTVSEIRPVGSEKTRTAITYGSDLDLNKKTVQRITRQQRSCFKERLIRLLPSSCGFVHMGKKVITLTYTDSDRRESYIDMAFANTEFDTGISDHGQLYDFFQKKGLRSKPCACSSSPSLA